MTAEHLQIHAQEEEYRSLFDRGDESCVQDPFLGLLNVFENTDAFGALPDCDCPIILGQDRPQFNLGESVIVDFAQFQKNWNALTRGALEGLDWSNLFVGGGAVYSCLTGNFHSSLLTDIDIFFWGLDPEETQEKLRHVASVVAANTNTEGEARLSNIAATILLPHPYPLVQVVLQTYQTPAEVLYKFDIDSACLGFDGKSVWASRRGQLALRYHLNFYTLEPAHNRPGRYERRLFKYSRRGFGVALQQADYDTFKQEPVPHEAPLSRLVGPPLLMRFEAIASAPHQHYFINYASSMDESLEGGNIKCKICHKLFRKEDLTEDNLKTIQYYGTNAPVHWATQNIVYQDFDELHSFQRTFARGHVPRVGGVHALGCCQYSLVFEWELDLYTHPDDPQALIHASSTEHLSGGDEEPIAPTLTDCLALIGTCFKEQLISADTRGLLKELLFSQRSTRDFHEAVSDFYNSNDLSALAQRMKALALVSNLEKNIN